MKYKLSIIIPVFNTGSVLRETMYSVFSQNFDSYEVICVDDGSDDTETMKILREYNKIYDNMKLVVESHKGAAVARNKGMDLSNGKYILFLDSDDLYSSEFLKRMYDDISETQSDCSICGYYDDDKVVSPNSDSFTRFSEEYLCEFPIAPWTKIYRKSFLIENKIRFQNLPSSNDVKFYVLSLLLSKKVSTVCKSDLVWHRTNRTGQISAGRKAINFLKAVKSLKDELEIRHELTGDFKQKLLYFSIQTGLYELKNDNDEIFYLAFRDYLNEFNTKISNDTVEQRRVAWLSKPMDEWLYFVGDFHSQLFKNKDSILAALNDKKSIYMWGFGKRGKAFADFSKELKIKIKGIYDRNPKNEDFGIRFCSFQKMKEEADIVVISSFSIKDDYGFSELTEKGLDVLDLNRYCPL